MTISLLLFLIIVLAILFFIDFLQTRYLVTIGFKELNPFLGKKPSQERITLYFTLVQSFTPTLIIGIYSFLSKKSAFFLILLFLLLQGICVYRNTKLLKGKW